MHVENLAQVHNLKWAHFIAGISDFLVLPIGRKRDGYLYIGFHIGLRFCSIPELGAGMPRFMMVELSAVLLTGCVSTLSLRSSHEFFEAFGPPGYSLSTSLETLIPTSAHIPLAQILSFIEAIWFLTVVYIILERHRRFLICVLWTSQRRFVSFQQHDACFLSTHELTS